jgi:hypothetical protein
MLIHLLRIAVITIAVALVATLAVLVTRPQPPTVITVVAPPPAAAPQAVVPQVVVPQVPYARWGCHAPAWSSWGWTCY